MIDYQAINDALTVENVKTILTKLDIPFRETTDYLLMPTVCHHANVSEASYKLYYYYNTKLFMCYSEDGAMSIWKFLRCYYEVRDIEFNWYDDIYRLIVDSSNYEQKDFVSTDRYRSIKDKYIIHRKVKQLPEFNKNVLGCFVKKYPAEWLKDGISKAAMDKFNILYSISQNKIIIPHYDVDGRLVGIRGRALNTWEIENVGKYMPVQIEQTWYSHQLSMNLYGLNFNKENIKKSGICFLAEGEKSVLLSENFSFPNCTVAVCGSNFNKYALNILLKECHPKEIVICFDKEELPGEHKYFDKLYAICEKYKNYANFSFIYDRQNLLDLKDAPFDKGEETFKKLLEKRVIVR